MTLRKSVLAGLTFLLAGSVAQVATAQEDQSNSEVFNITEITCWDVLTLEEDERTSALLLLFGYYAGKFGSPEMSGDGIEKTFDRLMIYCDGSPDAKVFQLMSR